MPRDREVVVIIGCGCKKASTANKGPVSQPTTASLPASEVGFEVRMPGEEPQFFDTRPKANEFARGKGGATIHRVRASQGAAA